MTLFERLMALGVPCAPVLTVEQALALDHTKTREMVVELGGYKGPGLALKLDRTPGSVRLPPPAIGEHSREVLARFGISDDRIAALEAAETIR
jgi:crotonobetainyl-CoA:carnitine CoA-transferase CaiB-like acyl-CoA transferase